MCTHKIYYIFSKVSDDTAFCAVRQDQPIPAFLDGSNWLFARTFEAPFDKPLGFDFDQAEAATHKRDTYFFRRGFSFMASWHELEAA
ncbi:hypothetical protein FV232_23080 [Methylobacterium sp. WL30]|nr:hypothetical protein FV225_05600 [Methylobacterium sp. WL93]TXN51545.1 hypothetical protein FV227_07115 [Methylobacterium sp. WL119]TXN63549.1 hypothetical protein FV232_23080 [Methylobacterium sp. WL30]